MRLVLIISRLSVHLSLRLCIRMCLLICLCILRNLVSCGVRFVSKESMRLVLLIISCLSVHLSLRLCIRMCLFICLCILRNLVFCGVRFVLKESRRLILIISCLILRHIICLRPMSLRIPDSFRAGHFIWFISSEVRAMSLLSLPNSVISPNLRSF
jgi:hypothetical protein